MKHKEANQSAQVPWLVHSQLQQGHMVTTTVRETEYLAKENKTPMINTGQWFSKCPERLLFQGSKGSPFLTISLCEIQFLTKQHIIAD